MLMLRKQTRFLFTHEAPKKALHIIKKWSKVGKKDVETRVREVMGRGIKTSSTHKRKVMKFGGLSGIH